MQGFADGQWYSFVRNAWKVEPGLNQESDHSFRFQEAPGRIRTVPVPWREVRELLWFDGTSLIATADRLYELSAGKLRSLNWPRDKAVKQVAISPGGVLWVASDAGLYQAKNGGWQRVQILDGGGRAWAVRDVLGVTFDSKGQPWFATRAGVGCRTRKGWRFFEGKDGLPWNDFTGAWAGRHGVVWFGTHLGAIRFEHGRWAYRQGPLWLPNDDVSQIAVDSKGRAWFATARGVGWIERRPMTLAAKARFYEREIQRYIKRTPYGYVAEAHLRRIGDKSTADPQDSDNDGLWTAMYGAGECFSYAATKDPLSKARAKKAFEALRFLQMVTRGCAHAPPKGFIARSVRSVDLPNPNVGRLESDREAQKHDKLWKVYEPRWPKSADGRWYWKSDTSSDELDGHFFFYGLYYDFCADTEAERARVREVVRNTVDDLIEHGFTLIDFDGRPTRWAIFGPKYLNRDPNWWPERGLNSLSILSYLAVAAHVVGDPKYAAASRELVDRDGYAMNAMYPKVQQGPGSGNQSDDEMAFMDYYSLLRCSEDAQLKAMMRYSFYRYWVNEEPEMNPFFNFAYAGCNLNAAVPTPWGPVSLKPWPGWQADAMATLYGLPLDRLNWSHRNSHRLDVIFLPRVASGDLDNPDRPGERGYLVNGKVLPVENRQFDHWNTDPWQLDYGGNGDELASGAVFLLPYYMGLYQGFIEK